VTALVRCDVAEGAPLAAGLAAPRRAAAVLAVLSAMALVVLDAGIATMALPTLAGVFHTAPARAVLVITAYQAGLVMALLPAGALGERFGHRRVFATGVAIFALGSALSTLSPSLAWLVAARLVQGLGGAAVMAVGVALLRFSVAAGRLGAAIGWNALTVALASAAAPSLGAAILAAGHWRWLFATPLLLAPLALAAAAALPPTPRRAAAPDPASIGLNAAAWALLILAAELAPTDLRAAGILVAAGALAAALLVRREAPKARPLIPLDLLRRPAFRLSAIASVCCFAGQTAGLVALPFHLQHGLGLSAPAAGLYLAVWPSAVAITALVAGRLADRMPTATLCAAGAACLAAGLAGAAAGPAHGDPRPLLAVLGLGGVGFGLFQSPNNRTLFLSAPADRAGAAGGMQGTARVTGQTTGALMMTLLFTVLPAGAAPRTGLALACGLALAAGAASLLRGTRRPADPG
jgi:DHA2 family multidrug resistance protein-like MFS transporter